MLTADNIKSVLDYNPDTGVFVWKINASWRVRAGDIAGAINSEGYVTISYKRKAAKGHRLAWLYMHGDCPAMLDHVNGDRADNRITNLRPATASQNMWNKKLNPISRSGYKGVSERVGPKWNGKAKRIIATISINGKRKHLGLFPSAEDARQAYIKAAGLHFGEFARV